MTTSQLEYLLPLDAHLTSLLDLAAKRTPGELSTDDPHESFCGNPYCSVNGCPENHASGEVILNGPEYDGFQDSELRMHPKDAAFIAACAGRAEAGRRSTKAAIEMLNFLTVRTCDDSCGGGLPHASDVWIENILAEWPIESLT